MPGETCLHADEKSEGCREILHVSSMFVQISTIREEYIGTFPTLDRYVFYLGRHVSAFQWLLLYSVGDMPNIALKQVAK